MATLTLHVDDRFHEHLVEIAGKNGLCEKKFLIQAIVEKMDHLDDPAEVRDRLFRLNQTARHDDK
jgi:hypothetical protein